MKRQHLLVSLPIFPAKHSHQALHVPWIILKLSVEQTLHAEGKPQILLLEVDYLGLVEFILLREGGDIGVFETHHLHELDATVHQHDEHNGKTEQNTWPAGNCLAAFDIECGQCLLVQIDPTQHRLLVPSLEKLLWRRLFRATLPLHRSIFPC